ncbi:MAG: hypothetical protein GY938_16565 [Ketobacter sp.]|nr:hypothetical protein [Ketobacter sp.]
MTSKLRQREHKIEQLLTEHLELDQCVSHRNGGLVHFAMTWNGITAVCPITIKAMKSDANGMGETIMQACIEMWMGALKNHFTEDIVKHGQIFNELQNARG